MFQTESEEEMMDWVNTFHTSKGEMLERSKLKFESPLLPESIPEDDSAHPLMPGLSPNSGDYGNFPDTAELEKENRKLRVLFENVSTDEAVLTCTQKRPE